MNRETDLDLTMNTDLNYDRIMREHERQFARDRHPAGRHRKPMTSAERKRNDYLSFLASCMAVTFVALTLIVTVNLLAAGAMP